MRTINIHFEEISDYDDLYQTLKKKLSLPDYFGNNLDALYDTISGEIELPLHLNLVDLSVEQLEDFENLFETLEDLENDVDGFSFSILLEQYE